MNRDCIFLFISSDSVCLYTWAYTKKSPSVPKTRKYIAWMVFLLTIRHQRPDLWNMSIFITLRNIFIKFSYLAAVPPMTYMVIFFPYYGPFVFNTGFSCESAVFFAVDYVLRDPNILATHAGVAKRLKS